MYYYLFIMRLMVKLFYDEGILRGNMDTPN